VGERACGFGGCDRRQGSGDRGVQVIPASRGGAPIRDRSRHLESMTTALGASGEWR